MNIRKGTTIPIIQKKELRHRESKLFAQALNHYSSCSGEKPESQKKVEVKNLSHTFLYSVFILMLQGRE
jgi:hypothetical protein